MNETAARALEALDAMTAVYRQLIGLGMEKQEAIITNRTDVLMQVTHKESKILKEIASLEQNRLNAVRRLATESGIAGTAPVRLEQLVRLVHTASAKQALSEGAERLSSAISELQGLNDRNQQMIKLHLEYINYSIDVIAGPSEDEATYHRSLQDQGFVRMSQFDTKA